MKYAVIKINGSQYKVSEGQELLVDKLSSDKLKADVLLTVDGNTIAVGKPLLPNLSVSLKLIEEEVKGEKLTIQKFKAKSRYRRKTGFRPLYSKIMVESISAKKSK